MNISTTIRSLVISGLMCLIIIGFSSGSQAQRFSYSDSWGKQGFNLNQQGTAGVSLTFSVNEFSLSERPVNGEMMKEISFPGNLLQNDEGAPNLPSVSRYIAIPQGAVATVEIVNMRKEIFHNIEMAPAPHIPLETDRGPLQYNKNPGIFTKDAFYPASPVRLSDNSKIRGVDVVMLNVTPFQYNPVTKDLIVYRDLNVKVSFAGGTDQFGETKYRNRYWDPTLKDNILNAESIPAVNYSQQTVNRNLSEDTGYEYLIIVPNDPVFKQWADSIKAFRTEQGILTGIVTLAQIGGNTTTAIENYINNAYSTWTIPPVAILIMADYGTDANTTITSPTWDNYCVSDNMYADVDNDDLPDIVLARMTANNAAQLKVMVQKFLGYEKQPPTDPNFYAHPVTALGWQTERWFQICSEVVGGYWSHVQGKTPVRINAVYDGNPASDPWSTATNTSTVVSYFGPSGLGYIPATPQELGGFDGGTPQQVNDALNDGAFMLQHRDHGMETGWGEPSYTNSNISGLTNVGKLSYIMSVNCLTGKYNYSSECFAEKFHRYTYNNQYAGCVGILAASETSYSFVNDTYVWGMYDNMWPDFMPGYGAMYEQRGVLPAFGNAAGKYFLQQSSWPYNTDNKEVTYYLFHHHGDAFLTVFSEVPQQLAVSHNSIMISTATSFDVTATEGSFIALTYNGQIIGTATAGNGPTAVPVSPVPIGSHVKVCVTKQNYYRHYSEFLVISPDGPYVVTDSYTVNDPSGNNNQHLDFGEDAFLSLAEKNLGNSASLNTIVSVSLADPFITIVDNTENYDTVPAQQIKSVPDGFRVQIANNVPNNHSVLATVTATNGTDTWTSYMSLNCWAPYLTVGAITIDDVQGGNGNHRLDPGETADIIISNLNTGQSLAPGAEAAISTTTGFLTLNSSTYTVGDISPLGNETAIFNVSVNPTAPAGLPVGLIYSLTSGEYSAQKTFNIQVGLIVEDWETGDFSKFPWTFGGVQPWTLSQMGPYEGVYSAKSGAIANSSSSQLIISYNVPANDSLRFTCKVSSQLNKDYLKLYIDNVEKKSWSGTVNWTNVAVPVTAGTHTFKWIYSKDGSGTAGSDCAWLDFIIFPAPLVTTSYAGIDNFVCENSTFQCAGNAANYSTAAWTTSGTGTFSNTTILNPVYTPSAADISLGSVVLTLTVNGVSGTSADDMTLSIQHPSTSYAGANGSVCESAAYTLAGANATNYSHLHWTTSGTGVFNDASVLDAIYVPSQQDAAAGSVTLSLTASGQACEPVTSAMVLTVHSQPLPQFTGEMLICENTQNAQYSTPAVAGNTYQWTVNGGEIVAGAGTNAITVNWGAAGNGMITVLETSPFDCATALENVVLINPLPAPAISGEAAPCAGDTRTYSTNAVVAHTYDWNAGGATLVSGQNSADATIKWETAGSYTISVNEKNDITQCAKATQFIVNVNPQPVVPAIPAGVEEVDLYKAGSTEYTITGISGLNYTWQLLPADAGIIAGNGSSATVTWNSAFRGNATISAKASNVCGESNWSGDRTTRVFSSLGIGDGNEYNAIVLSPNPNRGEFMLKVNIPGETIQSVRVNDSHGKSITERKNINNSGTYTEAMHLMLASGTYYIVVETSRGVLSHKFEVSR